MKLPRVLWILLGVGCLAAPVCANPEPATVVPAAAPRTLVMAGRADAFRTYCQTGEGAKAFAKIRAELDRDFLAAPFPAEPVTYGDPSPSKRTSDMADLWRAQQDTCGRIATLAEAAALCWIVTGEEKYLAKAKKILLQTSAWHFAPDWQAGAVPGATDIYYNDEAHFRLWRKLPLVYDQIRDRLSADEKRTILAHFRERGTRSVTWIEKQGAISKVRRNSIESDVSSHPVRFMPMTGLVALALWDDLPEAREWWRYAYVFYRDQFSPWGGDEGGWGEGLAYWRATFEHAAFQDMLLALGDPLAYSTPFWKNSPLFALYNVQPYAHTTFGDVSNAGRFNLEPTTADYFEYLARVQKNGFFRSFAALCTDKRPRPIDKGLAGLDRSYPTSTEFIVRNFIVAGVPLPPARPLSDLPPNRFFADVGWVSLHSALGRPAEDIHVTFKASPYGSFSHSHADQNGFVLNAFGESLAINSAYREYHNSPHHEKWTRQTVSKNALLIDGVGQLPKSKKATGRITRFEERPRYVWTTGDATAAYQAAQKDKARVQRVTRDLIFIDQRFVVLRDRVVLTTPGRLSTLLHAEKHLEWDERAQSAVIRGEKGQATLRVNFLAKNAGALAAVLTSEFPVPVDPKYIGSEGSSVYVTGTWHNQQHLTVSSGDSRQEHEIFTVLWPERGNSAPPFSAKLNASGVLTITRPDGKIDRLTLTDTALTLN